MSDSHKKTIVIDGDVHPSALSVLEALNHFDTDINAVGDNEGWSQTLL